MNLIQKTWDELEQVDLNGPLIRYLVKGNDGAIFVSVLQVAYIADLTKRARCFIHPRLLYAYSKDQVKEVYEIRTE